MSLPFSTDQFLAVFADYNRAVWPAQIFLLAVGLALAILGYLRLPGTQRLIVLGLALLWAWMGAVYHLGFFRHINPAAVLFGAVFLVEAALLGVWGIRGNVATGGRLTGADLWLGSALLIYAFVIYPILGVAFGHRYPASPTFGLPCPTTIATLGLLVWMAPRPPWWLVVIPLLWALVGSSAAVTLGIREDFGLLAAGITAGAWFWLRSRKGAAQAA